MKTIFHGSKNIIEQPKFGLGNIWNDYGRAFYCTESLELAREWACQEPVNGYTNQYELEMDNLRVLNLDNGEYHILNWLAILLENRTFRKESDLAKEGAKYVRETFLPDYLDYDVIIGYRADDSYFSFANAFLNNMISLEKLEKAMYLGTLGEQVAIKSEKAFECLKYVSSERVDCTEYYAKRLSRDQEARGLFALTKETRTVDGIYLVDIIRQQWRNDDERIQRIISG